ncbi:transcription initiation factor TFIID subunit 9B-like [Hydractinia symbiolongicarpus]|uniref:transcription initiation factor TFIID subunit 9B-like n=1 Tax=Hydractinia symbiolongicarpus TaxID=13093 RepID=UPI00254C27A3|nr:transcription initiation factor TFIID subunit 9B-like [Hydractinia symbiolongicarpus]
MASQESSSNENANQPSKTTPKDALVMAAILKEMGVTEFEPRVINQMAEFAYRYITDVVEDARVYSFHANRKNVNIDDIKLAVSQKLDHSFTSPPPREFLLDIARSKNSLPLPLIADRSGIRLPPERYCLTSNNYKTKSSRKGNPANQRKQSASTSNKTKISSVPGNIATQKMQHQTQQLQQQQQHQLQLQQQQQQQQHQMQLQQQQQQQHQMQLQQQQQQHQMQLQQQQQMQQQSQIPRMQIPRMDQHQQLQQQNRPQQSLFPAMLKRKHEGDDDYDT